MSVIEMTQENFIDLLAQRAKQIEAFLSNYLSDDVREGEIARPSTLMKAVRHGVLNGGKRVRPFLVFEVAKMLGADESKATHAAAALECLHCYSLVHDDLPAMDDDDLRRGKPTVHVAFDEATGILAGDALLTLAFELTISTDSGVDTDTRCKLVAALSRDAGLSGMVGGQQYDLENENLEINQVMISRIHAMKTGALIRYACEAGALIAGSKKSDVDAMHSFGEILGLAFQLADDLLDVTSDAATMGKATGKDAGAGKQTLVQLHGVSWTQKRLNELVTQAEEILAPYGEQADVLRAAAHFVAKRNV